MRGKTVAITAIVLVVVLALVIVVPGFFLSQGKTLGERHQPLPYTPFDFTDNSLSYSDYVRFSEELLRTNRVDNPTPETVANLAPFILEPDASCARDAQGRSQRGAVVTHGLIDSPYSMRDFAEHLQAQCFYVLGVLMPDHGLRPGTFLESEWERWHAAVHFATRRLAQQANTLFLAGHSAGGALSLLEATQNQDVDAVILFTPALAITGAARYAKFVALLGKLFDKAAWMDVGPDDAIYRYESFPFTAAAQTWALTKALEAELESNDRQLPVFTVASVEDSTISTDAVLDYMAANTHPQSRTLLYSQHPVSVAENVEVVISNLPEQNILSLSHLGPMTPPSHPWFGLNGAYRSCGHYPTDSTEYERCKAGDRDFYGETTAENLQRGVVERIAFNPFYESMLERIDGFIQAVE